MAKNWKAQSSQDAMRLMLARSAAAVLPVHERRAAENRERACRSHSTLLRWFFAKKAQRAERCAERCRAEMAKAERIGTPTP